MPARPKARYDVHPAGAMVHEWRVALPEKTGRSFEEWMALIKENGPKQVAQARVWLKKEFAFGANTASWLAERALAEDPGLFDDDPASYLSLAPKYVREQYSGKKQELLPLYERVYSLARGLGKDVRICPCKTIVPIYREHVFAQVKPATTSRIDIGLCLTPMLKQGTKLPARLVDTGGFEKKDRITHRIPITGLPDIDDFVEAWLKKAYLFDAKPAR